MSDDTYADVSPAPKPGPVEDELRIWHLRPRSGGWAYEFEEYGNVDNRFHCYRSVTGLFVISSLHVLRQPNGNLEPEWCVSVSYRGQRADTRQTRRALQLFDAQDAEEDNHEPGVARKFWLPVREHLQRAECECKDEMTIVEPDGYEWQPALDERDIITIRRDNWVH